MSLQPNLPFIEPSESKTGEPFDFTAESVASPAASGRVLAFHKYWGKKPVEPLAFITERLTRRGDLVVDPFSGSGVAGFAAVGLKRRYLGIDINPIAVKISFHSYCGRLCHGSCASHLRRLPRGLKGKSTKPTSRRDTRSQQRTISGTAIGYKRSGLFHIDAASQHSNPALLTTQPSKNTNLIVLASDSLDSSRTHESTLSLS